MQEHMGSTSTRITIFSIADNRMPSVPGMHPDLVFPPGGQLRLQQRGPITEPPPHPEEGQRGLPVGMDPHGGVGALQRSIDLVDVVRPAPAHYKRVSTRYCPLILPQESLQMPQHSRRLGHHE